MNRTWIYALLVMASLPVSDVAGRCASEVPTYPCRRAATAPVIDGVIAGDPGWVNVPGATGFFKLGGGYTETKQTTVKAVWDDRYLYVAMICEEPDVAALHPVQKDGGDVWTDDGVEVFVQPAGGNAVFHFIVNTAGAHTGIEAAATVQDWRAAAQRGKDSYTIEMAFPWDGFGRTASGGEVWTATFCRNIFVTTSGGDQFTTWAPLERQFLEPEHFGRLVFATDTWTPDAEKTAENKLNAAYRASLTDTLTGLVDAFREYGPMLTAAQQMPAFRARAKSLQRTMTAVQQAAGNHNAPIAALRTAVTAGRPVAAAAYKLKYEVLFAQLFADQ